MNAEFLILKKKEKEKEKQSTHKKEVEMTSKKCSLASITKHQKL